MIRALSATWLTTLLSLAALGALTGRVVAQDVFQEGTPITVELMNGDKLSGILVDADGPVLVIQHDVFGRMEIPRAAVKPPAPPPSEPVTPVEPWTGKFDVAVSGSGGNTDNENFRVGLDAKHDYDEAVDVYTFSYTRSATDNDATAEKGFGQVRHEWKLTDSKWRPFVQGSFETDKFTDYDARAAVAAGFAYPCLDSEEHDITGRAGAGVSHKYGVSDPDVDETSYEALVGLDWLWTVSEISSFSFTADLYPSVSEPGDYRSVSKAAYETKVDPASAWYLKLGLDHYYDSEPGDGTRSTDYNYYLGLGRAF